jgi:hypothetical protein
VLVGVDLSARCGDVLAVPGLPERVHRLRAIKREHRDETSFLELDHESSLLPRNTTRSSRGAWRRQKRQSGCPREARRRKSWYAADYVDRAMVNGGAASALTESGGRTPQK